MPYRGQIIQDEITAALEEAAIATGRDAPLRGTLIKLTPAPEGVYPPPEPTETPYPITCLFAQYTPREVDGQAILSTDIRVLVAASGLPVEIETNDALEIEGTRYYVANSPSLRPGGVALLYDVQARKR